MITSPLERRPHGSAVGLAAVAAALALVGTAALAAAPASLNRVTDGDFEGGFISLTLPAVERFPLVANGWAARGSPVPQVIADPESAFEGRHVLRLLSGATRPVHVLQDLPVAMRGIEVRAAFRIDSGAQTLRLYSHWGRGDPSIGDLAVEVRLSAGELRVTTADLRTRVDADIAPGRWHVLGIVADPRDDVQTLSLDGRPLLSVPGSPSAPARTLMLGGADGAAGEFLWDGLRVSQLAELELAALQSRALGELPAAAAAGFTEPLDAAAMALGRGVPALALPEVRAARRRLSALVPRLLRREDGVDVARLRGLQTALDDLAALLDAERE